MASLGVEARDASKTVIRSLAVRKDLSTAIIRPVAVRVVSNRKLLLLAQGSGTRLAFVVDLLAVLVSLKVIKIKFVSAIFVFINYKLEVLFELILNDLIALISSSLIDYK